MPHIQRSMGTVFIDKKIFQAIGDSKICIPIFSTGYGSSGWCLRELEHMMKRRKTHELEVMPIFYDVKPSDVKLETGAYRDALTRQEKEPGAETVRGWAEALKKVTKIKGWDTKNTGSLKEVVDLLNVESKDIRLIGICGMGGIGKTTVAKVLYNELSTKFESRSFISNIREASKGSGLSNLQRQLAFDILGDVGVEFPSIDHGTNMIKDRFNRKKVLIFLDDVDHRSQLMAFAARSKWFGLGSRIVVTTKDRSVVSRFQDRFEHCLIYDAKELNNHESLQLFSKHAFRSNSPPKEFLSLSERVIAKTGALPLAIKVMGSILGVREKTAWQKTLEKMELCPLKDVKDKLMLSYEALDHHQLQIFLDIACFLAGEDKRVAYYMWDECGFFSG